MNTPSLRYGLLGGEPPVVSPSGSSILEKGYPNRYQPPVRQTMPQTVPRTGYQWPGPTPASAGPRVAAPIGPNPLMLPGGTYNAPNPGSVLPGNQL